MPGETSLRQKPQGLPPEMQIARRPHDFQVWTLCTDPGSLRLDPVPGRGCSRGSPGMLEGHRRSPGCIRLPAGNHRGRKWLPQGLDGQDWAISVAPSLPLTARVFPWLDGHLPSCVLYRKAAPQSCSHSPQKAWWPLGTLFPARPCGAFSWGLPWAAPEQDHSLRALRWRCPSGGLWWD